MADEILHNREAEENVLGCLMIDRSVATPIVGEVIKTLGPDSKVFFTRDNQLIYEAVLALDERGEPCTPISVAHELNGSKEILRAGGEERLYNLQAVIVEVESAPYYCEIIKDCYVRRRYRANLIRQAQMVNDLDEPFANVVEQVGTDYNNLTREYKPKGITAERGIDIMNTEYPKRESIIDDVIPFGLTLLAGEPKAGKSYMMLNLALAASSGGTAWSHYPVESQCGTLYISYESHYREIQERIKEMLGGEMPDPSFYFWNLAEIEDDFKLDALGISQLTQFIKDHNIRLVIVDVWEKAAPDVKIRGTSYQEDSAKLAPVSKFCKMNGICVVLIHHTRKGGDPEQEMNEISGSMALRSNPDTTLLLKIHESHMTQRRLLIEGRGIPKDEIAVNIDKHRPGVVSVIDTEEMERTLSPIMERILSVIQRDEILSLKEIAERVGVEPERIRMPLSRMVQNLHLNRPSHGKYSLPEAVPF